MKLDPFSSSTYAPSVKLAFTGQGARTRVGPRRPRKPDGARMEPVAKEARGAQSRGGRNMRGRSTETEPEAFRPGWHHLEDEAPSVAATPSRAPFNFGTMTGLEDF